MEMNHYGYLIYQILLFFLRKMKGCYVPLILPEKTNKKKNHPFAANHEYFYNFAKQISPMTNFRNILINNWWRRWLMHIVA